MSSCQAASIISIVIASWLGLEPSRWQDKRPMSTSRSRRKPNPRCPTCRAEFTALIQKEKILHVATLMLPQFTGGGGLNDIQDSEEDEDESEGEDNSYEDEDEDEEDEDEEDEERRKERMTRTSYENSMNTTGLQIEAERMKRVRQRARREPQSHSTSSKDLLSSSSVRRYTDRGSSRVASFIAEAQLRSGELDAFLNDMSVSISIRSKSRSSEGVGKKRNLKSTLAVAIAAAVAAKEQQDKAETQLQPPLTLSHRLSVT